MARGTVEEELQKDVEEEAYPLLSNEKFRDRPREATTPRVRKMYEFKLRKLPSYGHKEFT